jgi:hypothetical protein
LPVLPTGSDNKHLNYHLCNFQGQSCYCLIRGAPTEPFLKLRFVSLKFQLLDSTLILLVLLAAKLTTQISTGFLSFVG